MIFQARLLRNRQYIIQRDAMGLFIDADGLKLRRFKGPAYNPDPFREGVAASVGESTLGSEYRLVKLTAAYEPWKVVSIRKGAAVSTLGLDAMYPGSTIIEEVTLPDGYEVALIETPPLPFPQLGLQGPNLDFTSIKHQMERNPVGVLPMVGILNTIKQWLGKYPSILFGSHSERKLKTYLSILRHSGLTVQTLGDGWAVVSLDEIDVSELHPANWG